MYIPHNSPRQPLPTSSSHFGLDSWAAACQTATMRIAHLGWAALIGGLVLSAEHADAEEIGTCRFDRDTLSFAGSGVEQAECLLQKVEPRGEVSPQQLPQVLHDILASGGAPSPQALSAALAAFPDSYRAYAVEHSRDPVSQTEAGLPLRYFVIHDTSTPFLGNDPFPRDLDNDPLINSFDPYVVAEPVAHIFLNRQGQIWQGHEFAEPWRATKLESRVIGVPARGRFVHIETIQPRRFADGSDWLGDTRGPQPGFSHAQYRMLAALYVLVSARAGSWLIPAFHHTVDAGIPDAHDDPQNFDLNQFTRELERLIAAHSPR